MKLLRAAILVIALSVGACYAQAPTPKEVIRGFDVGACAPKEFISAHIEISKDALTIFKVAPGPDRIVELPSPVVYKFVSEDEEGKHYASIDFEIVVAKVDKDGFLIGSLYVKGESKVYAVFFGIESDGSKLAENAKMEYNTCLNVILTPKSKEAPKPSGIPKAEDPSVMKA